MYKKPRKARLLLFAGFAILISMNLYTFFIAYPQISSLDSGCCSNHPLAKDFSAFYVGAWRLFFNPSGVYWHGYLNDGEVSIFPPPEQYKYLPSFLLLVAPLLVFSYSQALVIFDAIQLLMLPVIAYLIYKLVGEKGVLLTFLVGVVALLLPSPTLNWGFSIAYFWQWKEGQSKVLETLLILLSFYFASTRNPRISGIFLGLSFFDPRFAIGSILLFLTFNRNKITTALSSLAITGMASNVALLYSPLTSGFLTMLFSTGLLSGFYPYAYIPLATVIALTVVFHAEVLSWFRSFSRSAIQKFIPSQKETLVPP